MKKLWIHTKTFGIKKDTDKIHISDDETFIPFCGLDTFNYEIQHTIKCVEKDELVINTLVGTSVYACESQQGIPNEYVCKKCLKKATKVLIG